MCDFFFLRIFRTKILILLVTIPSLPSCKMSSQKSTPNNQSHVQKDDTLTLIDKEKLVDQLLEEVKANSNYDSTAVQSTIDRILDKALSEGDFTDKKLNIAVYSPSYGYLEGLNTLGDAMFGVRATKAIRKALPNSTVQLIVGNPGEKSTIAEKINKIEPNINAKDQTDTDFKKFDILLNGPVTSRTPPKNIERNSEFNILEYGESTDSRSAGLNPQNLGIFVDPELDAFSKKPPAIIIDRLKMLDELKTTLLKDALLSKRSFEEYSRQNKLYYAYLHNRSALATYINAMSSLNASNQLTTQTLDIVAPSKNLGDFLDFSTEPEDAKTFQSWLDKEALGKAKISKIQVFKRDGETLSSPQEIILDGNKDGRVLRIFNIPGLPNDDIKTILKSSEKFAGFTGDQSFTEGISAKKLVFYENIKPRFHGSFARLAADINPELAGILGKLVGAATNSKNRSSIANFSDLVKLLESEQMMKDYDKFIDQIKEKYNLGDRLQMKIKRQAYLSEHPKLAEKISEMEKVIEANKAVELNDPKSTEKTTWVQNRLQELLAKPELKIKPLEIPARPEPTKATEIKIIK